MPRCPRCHDEYEPGVSRCADCDLDLVPDDVPLPPRIDARLGTFHPYVADAIVATLTHRGIPHEARPVGDMVEIDVDRDHRDDLRAELAVNYRDLVARLPQEQMYEVLARGETQPGWADAPRGAWVDRQGRVKVDRGDEEELVEDASRTVGPTLAVLGAILLIFGWWGGGSSQGLAVVAGTGLLLVGIFLPR